MHKFEILWEFSVRYRKCRRIAWNNMSSFLVEFYKTKLKNIHLNLLNIFWQFLLLDIKNIRILKSDIWKQHMKNSKLFDVSEVMHFLLHFKHQFVHLVSAKPQKSYKIFTVRLNELFKSLKARLYMASITRTSNSNIFWLIDFVQNDRNIASAIWAACFHW